MDRKSLLLEGLIEQLLQRKRVCLIGAGIVPSDLLEEVEKIAEEHNFEFVNNSEKKKDGQDVFELRLIPKEVVIEEEMKPDPLLKLTETKYKYEYEEKKGHNRPYKFHK